MLYGLYLSTAGMSVQDAQVDSIAHNLANQATPGFQKLLQSFMARQPESEEDPGAFMEEPLLDRIGGGVFLNKTRVDRAQGPIQETGRQLDFAINGSGYFSVRRGNEVLHTRAGNFQTDAEGYLRTSAGDLVLDRGGSPMQLAAPGDVAGLATRLAVKDFPKDALVKKQAGNALKFEGGQPTDKDPVGRVHQGHLEGSNVSTVAEMVNLIQAFRTYEANAQMISFQDESLARAVNDLPRMR